jgi:hypothetical protein
MLDLFVLVFLTMFIALLIVLVCLNLNVMFNKGKER